MPRRQWFARSLAFVVTFQLGAMSDQGHSQQAIETPPPPDTVTGKPRLFVLTDIGNEPDDQMALVRLLLYSNEIDIEGLVATTSVWQRDKVRPDLIGQIVDAYGGVRDKLVLHASGWPTADALRARIGSGPPIYGLAALQPGQLSQGAAALIKAADTPDPRPLWVSLWGGANVLAQALATVRATRTPEQLNAFEARLRVTSGSDQDDAAAWIRKEFPGVSFIGSPSSLDDEDYASATASGFSGDFYYRNCDGADSSLISNAWLDRNIRDKGPLGKAYPRSLYVMEGDSPQFLSFVDNGLASYRSPSWGGWGGRYVYRIPRGETRPIWTQGGGPFFQVDSRDKVDGTDGRPRLSDQATIWRWREAYQNDFAARMDWTIKPYSQANHPPQPAINGDKSDAPIFADAKVGTPITFDAGGSTDPDHQKLQFRWFAYPEAGFSKGVTLASVTLSGATGSRVTITPTAACKAEWLPSDQHALCNTGIAHVILAVTDDGHPALTRYRRIILTVRRD